MFILIKRSTLRAVHRKLDKIMATQDEIIAEQAKQLEVITKIGNETRKLTQQVGELIDIINKGEVKPELADKTAEVSAQLKIVDDLVEDIPPTSPA